MHSSAARRSLSGRVRSRSVDRAECLDGMGAPMDLEVESPLPHRIDGRLGNAHVRKTSAQVAPHVSQVIGERQVDDFRLLVPADFHGCPVATAIRKRAVHCDKTLPPRAVSDLIRRHVCRRLDRRKPHGQLDQPGKQHRKAIEDRLARKSLDLLNELAVLAGDFDERLNGFRRWGHGHHP